MAFCPGRLNVVPRTPSSVKWRMFVKPIFSDLPKSTNVLSKFREYADFDEGFSVEQIEDDFRNGESGMVIFKAAGVHMCMYYAPIEGTEWYMLMEVPYAAMNEILNHDENRTDGNRGFENPS